MYIYALTAIDFWEGEWSQIDCFVRENPNVGIAAIRLAMEASGAASSRGWEGDVRGEDIYAARHSHFGFDGSFKLEVTSTVIIGWKQDNNGGSFVASRHPIYCLDRMAYGDGPVARIYPHYPHPTDGVLAVA